MNAPIRVRITAWYALLLAATIAALSAFLVLQLRTDLRQTVDGEVRIGSAELIRTLTHDAGEDPGDPNDTADALQEFQEAAQSVLPSAGAAAQLLDGSGRVLMHHGDAGSTRPMVGEATRSAARAGAPRIITAQLGPNRQRYRVLVSSFSLHEEPRVLVVAESLQPVEDAVERVVVLLLVAGPAAIGLTAFVAHWLARKVLRPVERITADARRIGIDQLQERVAAPPVDDETGRLATTLNAMLARIEQGVREKHRLVADASHELRTPLTVMRTELEVALRSQQLTDAGRTVLDSTAEEVDRMSRIVDNLLTLSQVDEGKLELLTHRVDLRHMAEDAARGLHALAAGRQVTVEVDGPARAVQADPHRLQLALTNLIENAIKFSPRGSTVRVRTWAPQEGIGLTVTDEGPGVPVEHQDHLFDRFYRVDTAHTRTVGGSGLGLAICREVARAHGGTVWIDSQPGHGSAFSLQLPDWRQLPPGTDGEVEGAASGKG